MATGNDRIPRKLVSEVPTFEANAPISKVIPAVEKSKAAIINKGGFFFGIIDFRSIHRLNKSSLKLNRNAVAEDYVVKVPRITPTTSIDDIIYYFYRTGTTALPYSDGDEINGIIDRYTLLKVILSVDLIKGLTCEDIMSTPVLAIDARANLAQATGAMANHKVNRLVVMENGSMAGLLTSHDVTLKYSTAPERLPELKTKRYSSSSVSISSVMTKTPFTINATDDIKDAIREFINHNVSSLVVIKDSKPVGMLTISDIFASLIARRKSFENRIILSGFDRSTYEYEYDINEQAKAFIEKVEKFKKINVDYISINVKHLKNNRYEINAKVNIGKFGIIIVRVTDFVLDRTFAEALDKLMESIKKRKDQIEKKKYARIESV